jgi:hypothetical protein
MPKGVYARKTSAADKLPVMNISYNPAFNETDEQIDARISERFDILNLLTNACITGDSRALIVSGPAGLGKSFTVEKTLAEWDPNGVNHVIIKGYVRATGLVKLLYQYRDAGQVIVFDDADTIFFDDTSLNLLKAVCDTTEQRRVSWLSEGKLIDDESGVIVPRNFDFDGTIIFISNYDFDAMIDKGHKLAPHLNALISRSHYIDLALKTRRDYLIRIRQVIRAGMLSELTEKERSDVLNYIERNHHRLRELSLRIAIKIGNLRKSAENWERLANVTCCK